MVSDKETIGKLIFLFLEQFLKVINQAINQVLNSLKYPFFISQFFSSLPLIKNHKHGNLHSMNAVA